MKKYAMNERVVGWAVHKQVCKVCGNPANPGVSLTLMKKGELGASEESWCGVHIPDEVEKFLETERANWKRIAQIPPGADD